MMMRDDGRLAEVIAGSRVVGVGARAIRVMNKAAATSSTGGLAARVARFWLTSAPSVRRSAGGVVLLTAAITHTLLTLSQGVPPGWLWTLLPGIGIAVASVLLAFANASSGPEERR